ncbi:hypothetical protein CPC16_009537 [Podila verticillata]|nr:hypothetical protein CPC16_009537 [Podila verticillata]
MALPPSYSTLTAPHMEAARVCVITLNENDKIRLIAIPPELVQAVLQAIHTGWGKVQREQDYAGAHEFKLVAGGRERILDMSKKQTDKDSFFFELGPVVDPKADMFAISFNKSDRIRVIDAPILHEKEYEGSIEFKLLVNLFYSDRHGAVYARMLMAQLLANLRSQGYKLHCSADVSFDVDGMDLDSWIFRRVGPAWS